MSDLDLVKGLSKACQRFMLSRYCADSPSEIIVNRLDNPDRIMDALSQANRSHVRITLPRLSREHALVEFCERNYAYRISVGD